MPAQYERSSAAAGLVAEQRRVGCEVLATLPLPLPEPLQLRDEPVREEHVCRLAALGDRGTNARTGAWRSVRREHVAQV